MNEVPEENGMILSGKVNMRHFVKCMKLKGQYWILLLRWGSAEQPTIDTKKYMITMILKRISWYRYQLIKNLHKILDKPKNFTYCNSPVLYFL